MPSLWASCKKHLLLHQLLAHLLLEILQQHWIVGVLRAALAQLVLRHLIHVRLGDGIARGEDAAVPVRVDDGVGVGRRSAAAAEAGNQVQHHGDRSRADDDHDQRLDHAISVCRKRIMDGL